MKVIKTNNSKFGNFMRKNGGFLVLALVVVSVCIAVYAGGKTIKNSLISQNSSEINLSGDDKDWNVSSKNQMTQQADVPPSSTSQLQSSEQSSSSSKQSGSLNSSSQPLNSGVSQEILFISPVSGDVLNKFSGNKPVKSKTMGDWRLHTGIDIAARKGTSVKASAEGIVSKIYSDDMWGTTVEIEHPNNMTTIYSSLADTVFVKKGQSVESGQSIGMVDNSAKIELAEDIHLHFAVKKDGKYLNPEEIITKPIGSKK